MTVIRAVVIENKNSSRVILLTVVEYSTFLFSSHKIHAK